MIRDVHKILNTILISTAAIGTSFCLYGCNENKTNVLDLAFQNLKLELKDLNKPLYLAKQVFFNYNDVEYSFDVDWSYTNQDHWKELTDYDNNSYILEVKEYYDEFDFDITATIKHERNLKSKTFHGNYVNTFNSSNGIEALASLEEDQEIIIDGMAINIYEHNHFVFNDGKKSVLVEIDNSDIITYNIKISLVLKAKRSVVKINGENVERITAKYVNHRNITSAYGEILDYAKVPYSLEELYDYTRIINIDNYNKLDQNIVQTEGIITSQNERYYICKDDIALEISSKDSKFFEMLIKDFIGATCTIDLFVDAVAEDDIIIDYNFSLINIFINN
ncbi:MAG: hypothetical protein J1F31_06030 [Erysipelotrichales bacterium]|nr:hypothetical protein [Erysipelotrichales bacterium]